MTWWPQSIEIPASAGNQEPFGAEKVRDLADRVFLALTRTCKIGDCV